jgi:hypothetical protein
VRADGSLDFHLRRIPVGGRVGLADQVEGNLAGERSGPGDETRTLQKRPPVHRRESSSCDAAETWTSCAGGVGRTIVYFGQQHDPSSSY